MVDLGNQAESMAVHKDTRDKVLGIPGNSVIAGVLGALAGLLAKVPLSVYIQHGFHAK
jgi:hypothetical protein